MAKWREESDKTIKGSGDDSRPTPQGTNAADPTQTSGQAATAPARRDEPSGRRFRHAIRHTIRHTSGLRTRVRRVSDSAAGLVGVVAMIICVLLALHITFVVFSANDDNSIVSAVNGWADWFAWRFRDMFVPKDERVGVLVNYGIAAVVYLIAGRVVAGLIRRIR